MAKKTVATLQGKSKRLTKVIKMVKSPKTGAYTFVEGVMAPELAEEFLKKEISKPLIRAFLLFPVIKIITQQTIHAR